MATLNAGLTRHRFDLALAVLFVCIVAPFVQMLTAQGAARYTLTAALLEQRTFQLDDYVDNLGIDRVEIGGHVYSDKAPGQPVLGVPVLAAAEALGAEPGTVPRVRGNLGVWSQTLAFCTIPGAALLVLMRRHALRTMPDPHATLAAMALSFSTMLLPFSSHLWGHAFTAAVLFGAWHLLSAPEQQRPVVIALAGVLAAVATGSEYQAFYVAAVLGLWTLWNRGWRTAAIFSAPHIVVFPLLLLHNRAVYQSNATGYTAKTDGGKLNFIGMPDPRFLFEIFFGAKGFVFTPIIILGVVALIHLLWNKQQEFLVPAAVFVGLLMLQAGWGNPWGGEGPGPRYITPALPFLVVPIGIGLRWISRTTVIALVGLGSLSMGLVLLAPDIIPDGSTLVVGHLRNIEIFGVSPTIFTMALGSYGWLVHMGVVTLAAVATISAWRMTRIADRPDHPGLEVSASACARSAG